MLGVLLLGIVGGIILWMSVASLGWGDAFLVWVCAAAMTAAIVFGLQLVAS